ncbi:hypothetical protein [Fodinicola feengrottensis]|uniref:Uncharacterized protein n=2 Tax=Fodinicola feengrottensis TaxID=435914 RepID=A0ABN2GKK8_9ACTN|nr:hypothetical protein [Fodinicola feengrottensis]
MQEINWWLDLANAPAWFSDLLQWLTVVSVLVCSIVFLVFCVVGGYWFERRHEEDTADFLARWGLFCDPRTHASHGSFGGVDVTLRVVHGPDIDGQPSFRLV